uniref:Uncharacterized protein n=1 Tax=viral metagenome TaxID=1070528 RepID=A0A6M3K0K0_9ZZZZ
MRVKHRRYGRSSADARADATHVIKIGWKTGPKGKELPIKLNGFLLCWNSLDANNHRLIDMGCMEALGFTRDGVGRALTEQWKAPAELLPQHLHFVIMEDASEIEDEPGLWNYPFLAEQYVNMDTRCGFRRCQGDGVKALRHFNDGTAREIECVPYGRRDADPKTFCQYSGPGRPCKDRLTFQCCLYHRVGDEVAPLSRELGLNARFQFETSSEHCALSGFRSLDAAARRVKGHLCGITGTMAFQRRGRVSNEGRQIVGHVAISLDEASVLRREWQVSKGIGRLDAMLIDGALRAPASPTGLPAPEAFAIPIEEVPNEEMGAPPEEEMAAPVEEDAAVPVDLLAPVSESSPQSAADAANLIASMSDAALVKALTEAAGDAFPEVAAFEFEGPGGETSEMQPPNAAWFLEGDSAAKQQFRRERLREICVELTQDEWARAVFERARNQDRRQ